MKDFIQTNQLSMLQFYGIIIRIDVILIDNKSHIWVVTKRTCNKKDDETWTFSEMNSAIVKYKDLIKTTKTTWSSEIADLI